MTPEESRKQTEKHIERVAQLLEVIVEQLRERALSHDARKLTSPEVAMFADVTDSLRGLTYGSDEYKEQLQKMLGVALVHHYEHNRHHPEHWPNGIEDMSLVDLLEMMVDWRAATERHADGDILKSIEHNTERFGLSEQLAQILRNSVGLFE